MELKQYEMVYLSVKDLIKYENNTKTHPETQVEKIANSIKLYGFDQPIVVDCENIIIKGHGRLMGANMLGIDKVPVIVRHDLTKIQAAAARIADNRVAEAPWDENLLPIELDMLQANGININDDIGFSDDEISKIFRDREMEDQSEEDDEIPDMPYTPVTKKGDIWILENHRVMCGDSTIVDEVDRLMNGEKADMVFTDPPYGINEQTDRAFESRTRICKGNTFDKIIGDTSTQTAIDSYNLCESLNIPIMIFWGANYYCHSLPESANWLVWDKREEEKERDMNSDCELAWVKSNAKSVRIFRHKWKGMIKASEHGEARVHPTQKPVALADWCFHEYGKDTKNILDLFGGSGTTLIACEKTNRKCFMMEISPSYVDIIIKRWEKFSGNKAILESTGEEFKDVSNG